MKIIREGLDPATIPLQATCGTCKTKVEFMPAEAKFCSDQRDGGFYQIKCPICPSTITRSIVSGGHQNDR